MEFRPWMLEAAWEYIAAAKLLYPANRHTPSMVCVGIGFEILFKSFQAQVDGPVGGIGEQYCATKGHNLLVLFDAIPDAIRNRFGWNVQRDHFDGRMAELFTACRYPYEQKALPGATDAIIDTAEEMVAQVIQAYKDDGCDDPWVQMSPNV